MHRLRNTLILVTFLIGSLILPAGEALSLPEGETIESGTATFDRSEPNTLSITTDSDKTIINYTTFSIQNNEYVYFYMPSASSSALNRVTGNDISSIMGSLNANGRIFIVNPNGIVFGPQARIDVGSLVASTLDIDNADFLNDNYSFTKLNQEGVSG